MFVNKKGEASMKKIFPYRKKLSFIITLALLVNLFMPASSVKVYGDTLKKNKVKNKNYTVNLGYTKPSIEIKRREGYVKTNLSLPSKYDSRSYGDVTEVKNQGGINDCWAFSSMASLESSTLKRTGRSYDFSEINLAVNNGLTGPDDGGNDHIATAYLSNWKGPVYEIDDPYPNPAIPSNIIPRTNLSPKFHVQNVIYLPPRQTILDNSFIKESVMKYGLVTASILWDDSMYSENKSSFYNNSTRSVNHAVTIVGWDDSYPKENFVNTPTGNGAFICKNSWGKNFGDEGYFYVSYYDLTIGDDCSVFNNLEPLYNYDYLYSRTKGNAYSGMKSSGFVAANVFDKSNTESQELTAVSLTTYEQGNSYEIYFEPNYELNGFNNIMNNKIAAGTLKDAGYQTIPLPKLYKIQGSKFAIAIKFTNDTGYIRFENDADASNSYISFNNGASFNKSTYGALDLKAFTKKSINVPASSITLNYSNLNVNSTEKKQLTANVSPSNADRKEIIWSSSNVDVVKVDDTGLITPVKNGQAIITASSLDGTAKTTCTVNVTIPLKAMDVSPDNGYSISSDSTYKIRFDNVIYKGNNFDGIILKDENNISLSKTLTVSGDTLIITPTDRKNGGLHSITIPKDSLKNVSGLGLSQDFQKSYTLKYNYISSIKFSDASLEREIRNKLGNLTGDISSTDMEKLTTLNVYYPSVKIKSLGGLEYAVNLKDLRLSDNSIISLNPIKSLSMLTYLDLSNNKIIDLEPITNLTNLTTLSLSDNKISSILPLKNLRKLQAINLESNRISDISSIENHENLLALDLSYNLIRNINKLPSLNKVTNVSLSYNKIDNISFLFNSVSNISRVEQCYIDVSNNYITDTTSTVFNNNIASLKSKMINTNYISQSNGIIIKDFANSNEKKAVKDLDINKSLVLSFENEIESDSNFNSICLYDSNFNNISAKVTLDSNKVLIKPEGSLTIGQNYYIQLNNNSIKEKLTLKPNVYTWINFSTAQNFRGDTDGNNKIDIVDLANIAKSYNMTIDNKYEWNFNYDINEDGILDIYDISYTAHLLTQ